MTRKNRDENQKSDSHRCDAYINYDTEEITIGIKQANELNQVLAGECDICGREIRIHIGIDIEMMKVVNENSESILYEY